MIFLTKIKLGGITNLSDARYAAAAGIDYIGFCFDTDRQNYIAPIKAKEIIDWVNGCEIVAEFGDQTIDEIQTISELINVDMIELNNSILPDELSIFDKPIIKKIEVGNYTVQTLIKEIDAYKKVVDYFHLYSSNNKNPFDEQLLIELCSQQKIFYGFDLNFNDITSKINTYKPYAVNLTGGDEEKTGYKDFEEMNELLDLIRIEN